MSALADRLQQLSPEQRLYSLQVRRSYLLIWPMSVIESGFNAY